MDYTEVRFFNNPDINEVIIALLAESDFDMFEEREDGVNGYVKANLYNEEFVRSMLQSNEVLSGVRFESNVIKDRNWNKEWEKNFEPVLIADRVFIRAPFHPSGNYPHELIIEPKMSFGTGHHATTSMMIQLMLTLDLNEKTVLDMGSGSGVLAIFAEQLGAKKIAAIDFDEWAFENAVENVERNNCNKINVEKGTVALIADQSFDVILANINRNVLLNDMEQYVKSLVTGGEILFSGILTSDQEILSNHAASCGLTFVNAITQENWMALHFKK